MTMAPIPVSNVMDSSFGICSSPNIRLGNEDSESQEPQILLQNPSMTFCELPINCSVLPRSHWITDNLEAGVSKKNLPSAPTWEYYLPWELLNSTQRVHGKLAFCPSLPGGSSHQSWVNFFKSIFSLLSPSPSSNCLLLKIQFKSTRPPDRRQRGKQSVKIRAGST